MDLCIRGYHVYEEIWTAVFREKLYTEREIGNIVDCYAVAIKKDSVKQLAICLKNLTNVQYVYTRRWRNVMYSDWKSKIFIQGGLEI